MQRTYRHIVPGRLCNDVQCQDGERILNEHSDFLDAEEDGRCADSHRDGEPVEGVPQSEGEEHEEEDQEAGGEASVGEGDGGLEQTLASSDVISEGGKVGFLEAGCREHNRRRWKDMSEWS